MRSNLRNFGFGLALACVLPAALAQNAFRVSDIDLRDPHVFYNFGVGCVDFTDTGILGFSFNGSLQTSVQTDGNGDGFLDSSTVVEFFPLDTSQSTNLLHGGKARCTAPMATTTCTAVLVPDLAGNGPIQTSGQCLAPVAGTTRPYNPAITAPGPTCFASVVDDVTLEFGGIPITLRDAQVAATFSGAPIDRLVNGLLRGFLTEADANNTLIPATYPVIGGQPLSRLLPGGTGNCALHSDKDTHAGAPGWWFYFNFVADDVQIVDPFASGFSNGFE